MKEEHAFGLALAVALALMLVTEGAGRHHGKPTPSPTPAPSPTPSPTPVPSPSPTPIISVTLAWDPSTGATGYKLVFGFSSGGENAAIDTGPATTWTVTLTSGLTYYFVVAAYNSAGESLFSNEVSYTAP